MKGKKLIITVFTLIILSVLLAGCSFLFSTGDKDPKVNKVQIVLHLENDAVFTEDTEVFIDSTTMSTVIPSTKPTRTGYVFEGWYTNEARTERLASGVKITESVLNIYVKWEVAVFDVKIVDAVNGDKIERVEYGRTLNVSEPTNEGYDFAGWYSDEARTQAFTITSPITAETFIYVKWNYKSFTITYELNGGSFDENAEVVRNYNVKSEVTLSDRVSKDGFDFIGWYDNAGLSGDPVESFTDETGNKTFYAKYLSLYAEMSAKDGLSEKTANGNEEYDGFFEMYTSSEANIFTITDYFTFSQNASIVVKDDEDAVLANNIFDLSANAGENTLDREYSVTVTSESGRVTKKYFLSVKQYGTGTVTVNYEVDENIVHHDSYNKGHYLAESAAYEWDGEKVGYEFAYWAKKGTAARYPFNRTVTENLSVYAVFTPVEYMITYHLGTTKNDEDNPVSYNIEDNITLNDAIAPDGYTFVGWFDSDEYDNEITVINGRTGNISLYAQITKPAIWNFTKLTGEFDYSVTVDEYPDLIDYLLFNRIASAVVQIRDGTSALPGEFYTARTGLVSLNGRISCSHLTDGTKSELTITYYNPASPDKSSTSGTYPQTTFVELTNRSDDVREVTFNDFAVDHIEGSMVVSNTEQLFFALQNGYRPECVAESVAETVYTGMKAILKEIINDDMSEKEKALAISEYLVKSIAYDNSVYNQYLAILADGTLTQEQRDAALTSTANYKCFYLEGAILDKVAVCDGISKAFACLCRMEGIEALQVSGTHGGTNHAWNKVKLDLNGDGTKEWTAVDCTSANLLLGGTQEVMNHAFIFTTDDMLTDKEAYVYNSEYMDGAVPKYYANTYYNIYEQVTVGNGIALTVENNVHKQSKLQAIFSYYRAKYLATDSEDLPLSFSFCVPEEVVFSGTGNNRTYTTEMTNAWLAAGFEISDINNVRFVEESCQNDDYIVFIFYISVN